MGMSKTQAMKDLERSSISNQQALVTKIQGTTTTSTVKRTIPGGKDLLTNITRENLPKACYTWLRHCAHFTSFTISFAKDLEELTTKKQKVLDFNPKQNNFEWDLRGKKWLGERVAENLLKENVIAVEGNKDGLWIHSTKETLSPDAENWEPYVEFSRFKPGTL